MGTRRTATKRSRQPARGVAALTQNRRQSAAPTRPVGSHGDSPLGNIEFLLGDGGSITIGAIASIRCAATAAADWGPLAMLQRRDGESFLELLARLDAAIGLALEDPAQYIDEVNAPSARTR